MYKYVCVLAVYIEGCGIHVADSYSGALCILLLQLMNRAICIQEQVQLSYEWYSVEQ